MTFIRLFSLLAALTLAAPAMAADVVYPTGSRIGLVPPPGMHAISGLFMGYEDDDHVSAIMTAALPPEAYAQIESSLDTDALKAQGLTVESNEPLTLAAGKAFLLVGSQQIGPTAVHKWMLVVSAGDVTALVTAQIPDMARDTYPDAVIHAALESVAMRTTVPVEEQLSLLPFKVGDLADFHIAGIAPGRALYLSDGAVAGPTPKSEAHIVVALGSGAPAETTDREEFARQAFSTVPNLTDVRITGSEPLRMNGQIGHEIMAVGKDRSNGLDVTIVQWLRFGGNAFMQIVGIARTDNWPQAYPRFRSVRDSIDTER